MNQNEGSARLFRRAQQLMPGGVNSPVRAFRGVGGEPLFVDHADGPRIFDVDGNSYIDYVLSWGAIILGHAHPAIVRAVQDAASRGTSFGIPNVQEVEMAELVTSLLPAVEMVRFVSSGTEATMAAVRLARGYTGRDLVLKFSGCYHGHGDSFLVQAGSGVATLGLPDSPGVPAALAALTLTVPYNDLDAVDDVFRRQGDRIACVIVEPVVGNAGFIPPLPGFHEGLRRITRDHGALLIFDEVMTGFRVALTGAQGLFGIEPDLTTLGKVVGGGLPAAAFGGRREIMQRIAPSGPIYQAGTLSGNPLAMAAGCAQLLFLRESNPYAELERRANLLVDGLLGAARETGVAAWGGAVGGMWGFHFAEGPVRNYEEAKQSDVALFRRFFWGCLRRGINLAPSAYEASFISVAHGDAEVNQTVQAFRESLSEAARQ